MDGVRGCRETGRHRIRHLMAISLCITPLIPPTNKAVHLQVREGKDESGAVIHQSLLSAAYTEVQALNSISRP